MGNRQALDADRRPHRIFRWGRLLGKVLLYEQWCMGGGTHSPGSTGGPPAGVKLMGSRFESYSVGSLLAPFPFLWHLLCALPGEATQRRFPGSAPHLGVLHPDFFHGSVLLSCRGVRRRHISLRNCRVAPSRLHLSQHRGGLGLGSFLCLPTLS